MRLQDVVDCLGLGVVTSGGSLDKEITGGYVSDLLSDVIAHGRKGSLWITLQAHPNIIAVATLKDLAGVLLVNGKMAGAETTAKARQEQIPVLTTQLSAFEVVGRLYQMGIRGHVDAAAL